MGGSIDELNKEKKEVLTPGVGQVVDEMTGMLREQTESLVPKDIRNKLYQPLVKRLWVVGVYMAIGTLWGWRYGFGVMGWWVGCLLGYFLLDVDHLLDVYFIHPEKQHNKEVKESVKVGNWKKVWEVILQTAPVRSQLIMHSIVFEVVTIVLSVYVVTSIGDLFGKAVVLSLVLRILYEQVREFLKKGSMDSWFWQLREEVPHSLQTVFLTVGIVVWLFLSVVAF